MVVAEALVVGAVAGLVDVEQGDDEPGRSSSRPTRLVAWMYSECVLGWPSTTIRPSRGMSRPTEIMLVAMAQSTRWRFVEGAFEAPPRLGHFVGGHTGGQLHHLGEGLAVLEQPVRLADALAPAVALERVLDLVLEDAAARRPARAGC